MGHLIKIYSHENCLKMRNVSYTQLICWQAGSTIPFLPYSSNIWQGKKKEFNKVEPWII